MYFAIPMETPLYPIFLSLRGRACLVAGFGGVGRRKVAGLLACGPDEIRILDPRPPQDGEGLRLAAHPAVRLLPRACGEDDVRGCALAFAATDRREENARIAALCARLGVPCNVADSREESAFLVPAAARRGDVCAALSTGGASPALARIWRKELEGWLEPRVRAAALLGRLRPLVTGLGLGPDRDAEIFRSVAAMPPDLPDDPERCRRWLEDRLPAGLHHHIPELLDALS